MADLIDRGELLKTLYEDHKCMNSHFLAAVRLAHSVNRWIPVEDALPEEDVSVLCYMRIGEIVVMEYGVDGWYCGVTRYNPRAVTHWMYLPEPPKE